MVESSAKMPVASAEKKKPGWVRTTVLWTVNIAMYSAIYWMFSDDPSIVVVLAIIGIGLAAFVVIAGIGTVFTLRRWRRAQVEINDAVAALVRGQLDLAYEVFARWSEPSNTAVSALARHNLGWTLMRQGRLEEALAVLENNDAANERALKQVTLHGTSSVDLSLVCALLGKIEDAESWLRVTERRAATSANPSLSAMTVFARAVLDCRRERYEDAARLLDEQWPECEAALKGAELRPLRVVRAYAHAAMGPRNAGVADNLLASSRPVYDGEYDFMGVAWPAMQPFLLSHRLVREPARGVADGAEPVIAEDIVVVRDRASSAD
jgi:tetratricopeptide (TPR) repeat protein